MLSAEKHLSRCTLYALDASVALADLASSSSLEGRLEELRGRSVLIATRDQLTAALALIELDGIARRLILCPPDLTREQLPFVAATAGVDAVVSDVLSGAPDLNLEKNCFVTCSATLTRAASDRRQSCQTEWILLTSGTTGMPKMVAHTLASLTRAMLDDRQPDTSNVWGTFYDLRRYGGLQIFLRALLGGASMVVWSAGESIGDYLTRAGAHGVTHISGTPSHWRRAQMSPSAHKIAPRYVRLSGEIVDQAILDSLRAFYPKATVVHAFASTEAGVAFDVRDGRAGFPASLVGHHDADVELKVADGSLRIRSSRNAARYLGTSAETIAADDGFIDTRDMVELRADRYYFIGRRDGVINVGGLKVHPEEVEAIINRHPRVQMSLVRARKNAITGALVVADVVVKSDSGRSAANPGAQGLRTDILESCRRMLAPYKVPTLLRFVPSLEVGPSGKLARL